MKYNLEYRTASELFTLLKTAWLHGWNDNSEDRLASLMESRELQAYLGHHNRITKGRFTPDRFREELQSKSAS